MSTVATTRRDLALIQGWVMVPVTWQQITVGDTILGNDGETRYVVSIQKHFETAIVRVAHGGATQVGEKRLDEPVHVLEDSTGHRLAEHRGDPAVYRRKGHS
jgi:hypothetical protein